MDSSPLGGKNQSIGREDLSQRAVPHARVPSDLTESDIQQILEAHRKDATELNELSKHLSCLLYPIKVTHRN